MRILLLGGAGFIGKNLALTLASEEHDVFVFDQFDADYSGLENKKKIYIVKGNFIETDIFRDFFKKNHIDVVIHLIASIISETDFQNVLIEVQNILIATMEFINLMNEFGLKRIVYFSSGGVVYGKNGNHINSEADKLMPINSYGWIKVVIEKYIQYYSFQNDFQYLILRPSNPYGQYQNIFGKQGLIAVTLGKIVNNQPVEIWGDGSVVRDYIYITDLCEILSKLIQSDKWNEIYNIGSGKGYSVNNIIRIIEKITGRSFNVIYKDKRSVDIPTNILNIQKICNDIDICNFEFTEIEEGISRLWEFVKIKY